jgi:S1-C subfamily serine protease
MDIDRSRADAFLAWLLSIVFVAIAALMLPLLYGCAAAPAIPEVAGLSVAEQAARTVKVSRGCPTANPDYLEVSEASGVAVAPDTVLTAEHVVSCPGGDAALLRAQLAGGTAVAARVLWSAPNIDIAAIAVPGALADPRPYAPPRPGARICMEHATPARGRTCGAITAHAVLLVGFRVVDILHTAPTEPGNSGSGLYDDRGRLIGIVTHGMSVPPGGLASSLIGRTP